MRIVPKITFRTGARRGTLTGSRLGATLSLAAMGAGAAVAWGAQPDSRISSVGIVVMAVAACGLLVALARWTGSGDHAGFSARRRPADPADPHAHEATSGRRRA